MTSDEHKEVPTAKRRNISRGISRNTVTHKHPLNVKPAGNALIYSNSSLITKKEQLLGSFSSFSDELILDLLSYIDSPRDLLNLAHSSRILYSFVYDEDLWRKLYVKKALKQEKELGPDAPDYPLDIKSWKGSWRRTVLGIPRNKEANIKLEDNLLCSDVLFRPFQCSQVDYKELFKDLYQEEEESWKLKKTLNTRFGIQRIDEDAMTMELFNKDYHNKPFILTNKAESRWPEWTLKQLTSRFPNVKFRQESVKWPLDFYSQYFEDNQDESPLYLFDCQSEAMAKLVEEYQVPKIFKQDAFTSFNPNNYNKIDQSIKTCRPDYRWIIVGPERSGSTFHKDPNHTSAWNANLSGCKLWVMLPGDVKPPGVGTDDEESEVTSPVGIAEWVISGFYNDSIKLALDGRCQIGITFPGECMYVPSGWWHSVINLKDSVALTQNFVPTVDLPKVFNFLKNKNDQISGFHVKDFTNNLESFIKENDLNINEFDEFLSQVKLAILHNEDVGEYKNYPKLPVYEFFIQCLKKDENFKDLLEDSLEKLKRIEAENNQQKERNIVASKKWENLVNPIQEETNTFSFGFEESDDE